MRPEKQPQRRFLLTGQDKYSKITHRDKILLIKRVIFDETEIKETAQSLKINYSTAKTLMRKFKKHGEELDQEVMMGISHWYDVYQGERRRCGYRVVETGRGKRKRERKTGEEETLEGQDGKEGQEREKEGPTPIRILQQVLFRQ